MRRLRGSLKRPRLAKIERPERPTLRDLAPYYKREPIKSRPPLRGRRPPQEREAVEPQAAKQKPPAEQPSGIDRFLAGSNMGDDT